MELWTAKLLENPFFSGGFVLLVLGGLAAWLRNIPGQIWDSVKAKLVTTVTIENDDEAFVWINYWLSRQPYSGHSRRLTAFTVRGDEPYDPTREDGHAQVRICLAPAPGSHWFFYKRRLLYLNRYKQEQGAAAGTAGKRIEGFQFHLWTRNRQVVSDLLEEVRRLALPKEDHLEILTSSYGSWHVAFRQPPRAAASLVLPPGMWDDIMDDARRFLAGQEWYLEHGIPHRRGYLLHGPPGSGKTSLVKVLASELKLDIAVLSLNRMELDDESLLGLMSELQKRRAILLLEDIDAIFEERKRSGDANRSGVTFSGLLNALDGVGSAQRLIVVMTTNHPEKLDPALIRPGRADRKFNLDYATPEVAARLFASMMPDRPELADRFAAAMTSPRASTADLQGVLLKHRDDPEALFDDPEVSAILRGEVPERPAAAKPRGRSKSAARTGAADFEAAGRASIESDGISH